METKTLNFVEGMKLASIISKHVNLEEIVEQEPINFISEILNTLEPLDYLECLRLISLNRITGQEGGKYFLELFSSGMEKNKIMALVNTYRSIGFI